MRRFLRRLQRACLAFREAWVEPACRQCGCTHWFPCLDEFGGSCHWAGPDLCSACLNPEARTDA